ncbi:MAG: M1 family aminopeptidase [Bryobacterales bacterium]|nr:M1 family aminopeptidase [Bryobacteraceae bacterium]MDW8354730.1 M1 family aminopeptidase [Bryobacterales bacterium]
MSNKMRRAALLVAVTAAAAQETTRRPAIDVEHYAIQAEIRPEAHSLAATVEVRFRPQEENTYTAVFELHNALNVSKVEDEQGRPIQATRSRPDFTVRLTFPEVLPTGQIKTVRFYYDGVLRGREESPVYGIKFAAIQPDYAFLLYPARWFPVSGYTTDRYTADLRITVPEGYRVVCSGSEKSDRAASGKVAYSFRVSQPSFPGSLAVSRSDPAQIAAEGISTTVFFRGPHAEMAGAYAQETARVLTYLTGVFGLAPQANLTLFETEEGAPNGYSAGGIVFLSPRGIGREVNGRLLANQIARQWWGHLVSPVTRNHLWITNGAARYAELLYLHHTAGEAAFASALKDTYIEALTVDNPPLSQSGRWEDYAPELWASTAGKGAAVYHMLRTVIGEEPFFKLLKEVPDRSAWRSVSTDEFRRVTEELTGSNLQYFFIQWIESSGAPEFRMEYTIFRTQKGFRVVGKVAQDLDTFRMPVELKIETEGNPEMKTIEVVGTSSEFVVETFGKPKNVILDPNHKVLRLDDSIRVAVAIRRGEQFAEVGEFAEALKEYQKALEVNRYSSLAHYRIGEIFFLQNNYQSAANEFRAALDGDLDPPWVEVWSHINLGKIFDLTGQRERAINEYQQAIRTKDNTQGAQEEAAKYLKEPYQRPAPSY